MRSLYGLLTAVALFFVSLNGQAVSDTFRLPQEKHFGAIRMLTNGGENAEAYLSFDNTKLIYQATTEGMDCDQIFTMDLFGNNKTMVSTGHGRTTCAYYLPGDTTIVYASTHEADASCPPPPDRSKGYVWKLYESFDIFSSSADGSNLKRLTDAPGYDAEATVSPKGDKMVFTTLRDGDPEIYVMDLDGSNQKRLTHEKGYDGGPFFSHDGSKIVFRASRPKTADELKDYDDLVTNGYVRPTTLEIFVMDADGSNMKQVTNLGKASFAPFFHPDGQRIIFSSNAQSSDPRNFDLYMVNVDGTGLERITYYESFDGFPIFTADGRYLVFCSNRNSRIPGETNVFVAEWKD